MRKRHRFTAKVLGLVLALSTLTAFWVPTAEAQAIVHGAATASQFNYPAVTSQTAIAAGAATITVPCFVVAGGQSILPWVAGNHITVTGGGNTETVAITSVSTTNAPSACTVTATFSNSYSAGAYRITSGTNGVEEAMIALPAGGIVIIDPNYTGSSSNFTGTNATGGTTWSLADNRSGANDLYAWGGSSAGWTLIETNNSTANGAILKPFVLSENLTLSTGGTTTDTTANLLPANSIILSVTGRVTTTITAGCTGWQLGDPTTAGRFTASDTTLTSGETVPKSTIPPVHVGTGIASATTGMFQASAAKVRVTCATAAPGAGAVRITVFGYTIVPPAS